MMDAYTASELAYKNGYKKGYDEGFDKGYSQAVETVGQKFGYWKWTKDGDRVCSECGMLEPDSLPGACAIYKPEKRYCFYCGARLIYPEEQ